MLLNPNVRDGLESGWLHPKCSVGFLIGKRKKEIKFEEF
jgi:hypothetical protein